MRFYVARRNLMVEDGQSHEILLSSRGFMQNENAEKAAEWFRSLLPQLEVMEPFSDEMAAFLTEAEDKLAGVKLAEKCLEEVSFD